MIGSRVGYAGPARGGGGKVQRAQLEKAAPPVTAVPGWSAQTRAQRGTSVWNPGAPPPSSRAVSTPRTGETADRQGAAAGLRTSQVASQSRTCERYKLRSSQAGPGLGNGGRAAA